MLERLAGDVNMSLLKTPGGQEDPRGSGLVYCIAGFVTSLYVFSA